jgi:hypothetical protein
VPLTTTAVAYVVIKKSHSEGGKRGSSLRCPLELLVY